MRGPAQQRASFQGRHNVTCLGDCLKGLVSPQHSVSFEMTGNSATTNKLGHNGMGPTIGLCDILYGNAPIGEENWKMSAALK